MYAEHNIKAFVEKLPAWMSKSGPDGDVVLLSILRLYRNTVDFCFPGMMDASEKAQLLMRSEEAVKDLPASFTAHELSSVSPALRRMYQEQFYIPGDLDSAEDTGRRLLVSSDGGEAILLNGEDHFCLQSIGSGFALDEMYAGLESSDEVFEKYFSYAVSFDLGYLRSRIDRSGNGLEARILLHLPALSSDKRFEEVLAHAQREGMSLSRFASRENRSLGHVYQLSLSGELGSVEQELLEKLALVVIEFIHYEREARKDFIRDGNAAVDDRLWRDFAILGSSRILGLNEAIDRYSNVRLGRSVGVLPGSVMGPLLFLAGQSSHMAYAGESALMGESEDDLPPAEYVRAALYRHIIRI